MTVIRESYEGLLERESHDPRNIAGRLRNFALLPCGTDVSSGNLRLVISPTGAPTLWHESEVFDLSVLDTSEILAHRLQQLGVTDIDLNRLAIFARVQRH